jgi:hypothetical protein
MTALGGRVEVLLVSPKSTYPGRDSAGFVPEKVFNKFSEES